MMRARLALRLTLISGFLTFLLVLFHLLTLSRLTRPEPALDELQQQRTRALVALQRLTGILHDTARLVPPPPAIEPPPPAHRDLAAARAQLRNQTLELRLALPGELHVATDVENAFDGFLGAIQQVRAAQQQQQFAIASQLYQGDFLPRLFRLGNYFELLADRTRQHLIDHTQHTRTLQRQQRLRAAALTIVAFTLAMGLTYAAFHATLTRPFQTLLAYLRRLVAGDLHAPPPTCRTTNEFGEMAGLLRQLGRRLETDDCPQPTLPIAPSTAPPNPESLPLETPPDTPPSTPSEVPASPTSNPFHAPTIPALTPTVSAAAPRSPRRRRPVEELSNEKQLDLIPPPTPPPPPPLPGIEWDELQRRLTGTQQELAPALEAFRSTHRPTLDQLREHLAERRTDELRRLAHHWAEAAGNLSANELRRRAKTLELSLKFNQGDPSQLLEELEAEASKVLGGIDAFLAGPTADAAVDPTPSDHRPPPPEPTPETPTGPRPDRPETDDPPRSHT